MKIFRQEVLKNKNQSVTGEVLLPNTFSLKLFIIIVIVLLCLIFLFIIQFSYTDRKTVIGFLTPINGIINVYSPSTGSIDKLYITNEQQIKAGDTLLTIINKNSGKDVDYNLKTKHSLEKSMMILQDQMQLSEQQQNKEKDNLNNDIATLN